MKKLITTFGLVIAAVAALSQSHAIRVTRAGTGDPVIYLPGFTTPGSVWNETVKNVKGKFQSHLVSYAGFNGIAAIEMPWYPTIKQELLDYIEKEKLSNIRIIGHSMGGNLAVDIAAEISDKVNSIVLVDAIPCMRELMMPGVKAEQIQYKSPYNDQMLAMTDESFRQTARMMTEGMTNVVSKKDTLLHWSLTADRKTYVYGFTDLLKLDLRPALTRITAPVLILGAPFPDKQIVLSNFEKQYANLSNKSIAIADASRHFIMFDQPEWFYEKVNTFFSK